MKAFGDFKKSNKSVRKKCFLKMSSFFFRELKHMAGPILDFIAFDYRTMLPFEKIMKSFILMQNT